MHPTGWIGAIFQATGDDVAFPFYRICTRSSLRLMQAVRQQPEFYMIPTDLEREFEPRAVPYSDGLLILRPDDAIELIRRAQDRRIPVLGVDGFLISPGATYSPIEHTADFSRLVDRGNGCWEDAVAHIQDRRHLDLTFEVVLGDPLPPAA
jgi:hypothetical protein